MALSCPSRQPVTQAVGRLTFSTSIEIAQIDFVDVYKVTFMWGPIHCGFLLYERM
jgi:hypothetical protein